MARSESGSAQLADGLNLVLGIWLIVTAFFLTTYAGAFWSQLISGAVLLLVGIFLVSRPEEQTPSWVNVVVGAWLVVSAATMTGGAFPFWNQLISGVLAIVFAGWGMTVTPGLRAHPQGR